MMYVKTNHSIFGYSFRILLTVGYWENQEYKIVPATKESIERFLSIYNGKSVNLVVTNKNALYATYDVPGYTDGDVSTTFTAVMDSIQTYRVTETVTKDNIQQVIDSNQLCFFYDAGHGWLRVPLSLIRYLGINELITQGSYTDKKFAYLEEDQDMPNFLLAIGLPHAIEYKDLFRLFWGLCNRIDKGNCADIRNYPYYDSEKMKSVMFQSSLGSIDKLVYQLALG